MIDSVEIRRVIMDAVANHSASNLAQICSKTYLLLRPIREIRHSEVCENVETLVQVGLLTFEQVTVGEGYFERMVKHYRLTPLGQRWLETQKTQPERHSIFAGNSFTGLPAHFFLKYLPRTARIQIHDQSL